MRVGGSREDQSLTGIHPKVDAWSLGFRVWCFRPGAQDPAASRSLFPEHLTSKTGTYRLATLRFNALSWLAMPTDDPEPNPGASEPSPGSQPDQPAARLKPMTPEMRRFM